MYGVQNNLYDILVKLSKVPICSLSIDLFMRYNYNSLIFYMLKGFFLLNLDSP